MTTTPSMQVDASTLVRCEQLLDAFARDDVDRLTELLAPMILDPAEPLLALVLLAHGALAHAAESTGVNLEALTGALLTALGNGVHLDG